MPDMQELLHKLSSVHVETIRRELGGAYYEEEDKCVTIAARNCEAQMKEALETRERLLDLICLELVKPQ